MLDVLNIRHLRPGDISGHSLSLALFVSLRYAAARCPYGHLNCSPAAFRCFLCTRTPDCLEIQVRFNLL